MDGWLSSFSKGMDSCPHFLRVWIFSSMKEGEGNWLSSFYGGRDGCPISLMVSTVGCLLSLEVWLNQTVRSGFGS